MCLLLGKPSIMLNFCAKFCTYLLILLSLVDILNCFSLFLRTWLPTRILVRWFTFSFVFTFHFIGIRREQSRWTEGIIHIFVANYSDHVHHSGDFIAKMCAHCAERVIIIIISHRCRYLWKNPSVGSSMTRVGLSCRREEL